MNTVRTIKDLRNKTDLRDPRSFDHVGRDAGASSLLAGDVLADLASTDPRIVCGAADIQFVTHMAEFRLKHPDRFYQFGISERNMIGAAAGMAASGLRPYVSTFACFLGILGYENIRTDLAYPKLPVRLLATHAGISMGFFGTSHHATEDIAALRPVANLTVLSPSDGASFEALLRATVDVDGPVYFRLGRGRDPQIYQDANSIPGFGAPVKVAEGNGELVIVTTGSMITPAIGAARLLAEREGRDVATVFDVHSLKPFDGGPIAEAIEKGSMLLVVEEHNVEGGLGTIVVEALLEYGVVPPTYKHGLYDEYCIVGPPAHLYQYYGLSSDGIATIGKRLLQTSGRPAPRSLWTEKDRAGAVAAVEASRNDRAVKRA